MYEISETAGKSSASGPQLFLIVLHFSLTVIQIALIFIVHQCCFSDTDKEKKVMLTFCLQVELVLVVASNVNLTSSNCLLMRNMQYNQVKVIRSAKILKIFITMCLIAQQLSSNLEEDQKDAVYLTCTEADVEWAHSIFSCLLPLFPIFPPLVLLAIRTGFFHPESVLLLLQIPETVLLQQCGAQWWLYPWLLQMLIGITKTHKCTILTWTARLV